MPMQNGKYAGSEKDGSKSNIYCELCYKGGEFINPDMTIGEMKDFVDNALKEKGWWLPLRWMAKMQLPNLERWKTK
jgi:hypothetical protein